MSVKLILSNTCNNAEINIMRELKNNVSKGHSIIIVPDKYSLSAEISVLKNLNVDSTFDVEVMSFTRLATISLKDDLRRCLTPEGSVLLLRRAIKEVNDKLTTFNSAIENVDFPRELYAVITSLRNSGIFPCDLMKINKGSDLFPKILDIAVIYERYLELLANDLADSSTRLYAFADKIPLLNGIEDLNIYITGFYEFTAPQYDIIEKLISCSKSVTISLIIAEEYAANARIVPMRAKNKILDICKTVSVAPCAIETIENLAPYKRQILNNTFSFYPVDTVDIANDEITIAVAPTVSAEIEYIARNIRKDIVEKGLRYKDFAVIVSDIEGYSNEISHIFKRFGIPFFIDKQVTFSQQPAAKFIISAMKCAATDMRYSEICNLIKNPIFYRDEKGFEEVQNFENYCQTFSLTNKLKFKMEDDRAESLRKKIVALIKPFSSLKKATAADYSLVLEEFVNSSNLLEWCEKVAEEGSTEEEKAAAQIFDKLSNVLDEIKLTVKDIIFSLAEFTTLTENIFKNVKIALVPLFFDSVFVGEPNESRYDDVRIMYIAGAMDKSLPVPIKAIGVMGFEEEKLFISQGINFYPTIKEEFNKGNFELLQLFIKHKDKLIISYPTNYNGSETKPCLAVTQLSELFTKNKKSFKEIKISDSSYNDIHLKETERARLYAYKFSTQKNGYYHLLSDIAGENINRIQMEPYDAMADLLSDEDKYALKNALSNKDADLMKVKDNVTLNKGHFSASQLESYFACPYKQFFAYGLRIRQKQSGKMRSMDMGTITHAVMENFMSKKDFSSYTEDKIKDLINETVNTVLARHDFAIYQGKKYSDILERHKKECLQICLKLGKIISKSNFKPYLLEAKIGNRNNGAIFDGFKVSVNNKDYTLVGSIDRIDSYENYFTIIDYKSYDKSLSINDVYNGTCIQPVLYMASVSNDETLKNPVALLYQPILLGYKKPDENRFRAVGFLIDDEEILKDLDLSLLSESKSEFLPVTITQKGKVKKDSNTIIPDVDFTGMKLYAVKIATNAVNEIANGNINPSPYQESCKNCDYNVICKYENDKKLIRKKSYNIVSSDFIKLYNGEEVVIEK